MSDPLPLDLDKLEALAVEHDEEARSHSPLRPDIAGWHRRAAELDRAAVAELRALREENERLREKPLLIGGEDGLIDLTATVAAAREEALLGMLSVEPADPGHVHTRAMTARAREVLGIGDDPIALVQARRARSARKPAP